MFIISAPHVVGTIPFSVAIENIFIKIMFSSAASLAVVTILATHINWMIIAFLFYSILLFVIIKHILVLLVNHSNYYIHSIRLLKIIQIRNALS